MRFEVTREVPGFNRSGMAAQQPPRKPKNPFSEKSSLSTSATSASMQSSLPASPHHPPLASSSSTLTSSTSMYSPSSIHSATSSTTSSTSSNHSDHDLSQSVNNSANNSSSSLNSQSSSASGSSLNQSQNTYLHVFFKPKDAAPIDPVITQATTHDFHAIISSAPSAPSQTAQSMLSSHSSAQSTTLLPSHSSAQSSALFPLLPNPPVALAPTFSPAVHQASVDEDGSLPVLEGTLLKLSEKGLIKTWKKRYFIVRKGKLSYYRKTESDHLGSVDLINITEIKPVSGVLFAKQVQFTFDLVTPKTTFHLAAEKKESMDEWISILETQRAHWKNLHPPSDVEMEDNGPDGQENRESLDIDDEPDFSALIFRDQDDDDDSSEASRTSLWFDSLKVIWDQDVELGTKAYPSQISVYHEGNPFRTATVQNGCAMRDLLSAVTLEFDLLGESKYKVIKVNHLGEVSILKKSGSVLLMDDAFDRFFLLHASKMLLIVFFEDDSFEIVISSSEATVADICTYKPLINRLDNPGDANLYVRFSERKDICLDLDAKLFDDSDTSKNTSRLLLRSPHKLTSGYIDDTLHAGPQTYGKSPIELEGTFSNAERRHVQFSSVHGDPYSEFDEPSSLEEPAITSPLSSRPTSRRHSLHENKDAKGFDQAQTLTPAIPASQIEPSKPAATPTQKVDKLKAKKFSEVVTDSRSMVFGVFDHEHDSEGEQLASETSRDSNDSSSSLPSRKMDVTPSPPPRTESDPIQPKFSGKKVNPQTALERSGPLVISSPAVLRVTLPKVKRESSANMEISLSGVVLVMKNGLWALRDDQQASEVMNLRDAPGLQEGLKLEDIDLPGNFLARFFFGEKRWIVCHKPQDSGDTFPKESYRSSLDLHGDTDDDADHPLPAQMSHPATPEKLSPQDTSFVSEEEEMAAQALKMFGILNELQKSVRPVLDWFADESDPSSKEDLSLLVRRRFCDAIASLLMFGFKKQKISTPQVKKEQRITLWDVAVAGSSGSDEAAVKWQNSCKMLDSDPSMGMDPDVKFRTFLCIHLNNKQLSTWFASLVSQKEALLPFYSTNSVLDDPLAIKEVQRILTPLSELDFNLPLYFEVDLAELRQRTSKEAASSGSTMEVISESTLETLGKIKDSGVSLVSNLADTVWKAAPSVNALGELFSGSQTQAQELANMAAGTKSLEFAHDVEITRSEGESLGMGLMVHPDSGIVIAEIAKDSPAAKSNLKVGDRILKVNGVLANGWTPEQAAQALGVPGQTVSLVVSTKQKSDLAPIETRDMVGHVVGISRGPKGFGLGIPALHPKGALVTKVSPNGAAEATGRLFVGDLILEVNGKKIAGWSQEEISDFIRRSPALRLLVIPKDQIPNDL